MRHFSRAFGLAHLRLWVGLLVLGVVLAQVWLAAARPRQPDKKPAPGERPPEEEEVVPIKTKTIQDPDAEPPKTPAPPVVSTSVDLAQAAREARHPGVKVLFNSLASPHDVVFLNRPKAQQRIQPFPLRWTARQKPALSAEMQVVSLPEGGKTEAIKIERIERIESYEELAQEAVKKFLQEGWERQTEESGRHLSRYDQLLAAEQVLNAVLRFHESARQTGRRQAVDGDGWAKLETSLRVQLRDVLLEEMAELGNMKRWDSALALGKRLTDTYPKEKDLEIIAPPLADLLQTALKDPKTSSERMREVRQRLRQAVEQFSESPVLKQIGQDLRKQAQQLFDLAVAFGRKKEWAREQDLLQQAAEIWPQMPQLKKKWKETSEKFPILRVGIRAPHPPPEEPGKQPDLAAALPRFLSPTRACTDTERRAVELLFESLVKVSPDADGLLRYQSGLAQGRPVVIPLGRQFQLPPNGLFSNDERLTSADVRFSVRHTGRVLPCGDLLDNEVEAGDPFRVSVPLKQGYLDPLALMTFKILPQTGVTLREGESFAADSEQFALNPVGSGPFKYAGVRTDPILKRPYAAFVVNLNYGSRPGKVGLPRIGEIRFIPYTDPLKDLKLQDPKEGRLHLVLDLTAEEAQQIRQQQDELKVTIPEPGRDNRRIYFLAVNNNHKFLQYADLRRALALGINREKVLDPIRGIFGLKYHKALNGPFPAHSWPLHPEYHSKASKESLDPYDPDLAKTLFKQFQAKQAAGPIKLNLAYPSGDIQTQRAVEAIQKQLEPLLGITLMLVSVEPHQLRKDVQETQNYELAYYHYDFPDDTYSLWPLFGRGDNFLGIQGNLRGVVAKLRNRCDFLEVQKEMRVLHKDVLPLEMPLIPLWQLDPMMAIANDLTPAPFDPWLVFTDIDQWRLERR